MRVYGAKRWTKKEDEFILENCNYMSRDEMIPVLYSISGSVRTSEGIRQRLLKLGNNPHTVDIPVDRITRTGNVLIHRII